MCERNAYSACVSGTWSGPRVAAAIGRLKDAGMSEQRIAKLAGASRATANRWARGANRPDHDSVRRLAARLYGQHPDVARELVEASGYAWAEPDAEPEPPPIPREVLDVIRKTYPPDKQAEAIAMLQQLNAPSGQLEDEDRASRRGAGRAG
jgi:transcriptional regulator with XRE-family HTH domain